MFAKFAPSAIPQFYCYANPFFNAIPYREQMEVSNELAGIWKATAKEEALICRSTRTRKEEIVMAKTPDLIQKRVTATWRKQILDAATHVFAEKGFHRATIKEIMRVLRKQ